MNLATQYPQIFWNAACLTINAGADEEMEDSRTTQYGKVAKALGSIQKQGQELSLPFVNNAELGFAPSKNTNKISFSLKGISGVGDSLARAIIAHRPYDSLAQFCAKMEELKNTEPDFKCGSSAIMMLIKAGCFDELETKPREEIMKDYLRMITPSRDTLTTRDILTLDNMGLLTPEQRRYEKQLYRFKTAICQSKNFAFASGKSTATHFFKVESATALDFFYSHFVNDLVENKDYQYDNGGTLVVKKGSLEKIFDKLTASFKKNVLQNPRVIQQYNEYKLNEQLDAHAQGTLSRWEMESLCFYYHEHELAHVDKERYSLSNFADLPETPVVIEYRKRGNRELPRFQLNRICGTVLDKNKNKHLISVLTTDGVVDVKFYKGQYNFYDKQISEVNEDGSKSVLEKSWFTRGNKLLITGIRRGDQFAPRKYADSAYRHTVQLIKEVRDDGSIILQSERVGYGNE